MSLELRALTWVSVGRSYRLKPGRDGLENGWIGGLASWVLNCRPWEPGNVSMRPRLDEERGDWPSV